MRTRNAWFGGLVAIATLSSCYSGLEAGGKGGADAAGADGAGSGSSTAGADETGGPPPADATTVPTSGVRRLTSNEYDNTLRDLLFDDTRSSDLRLPKDARTPFDNDVAAQIPSQTLIEGAHFLAADAVDRLMADPAKRDTVVGCVPSGPADAACFTQFVDAFGRRALRRPLTQSERDEYLPLLDYATETGDFYTAVDSVVRAVLQDPEFLYRVEVGEPVDGEPGVFRLNDYEMGTRLSYFLLGTTPPDWLLDRADEGALSDEGGIREAAATLLADERAKARISRFHAMWMGYEGLPHELELSVAMQNESSKLIEKVVFGGAPYEELFTSTQTWLDDILAQHYGMPAPGAAKWVNYDSSGRAGILSHGSFLSVGGKFGDTSPTQRGILIRERLFCQVIPPPPPGVATDDPIPTTDDAFCKADRNAAHLEENGCAVCHLQMDPVGFGLENYDQAGRYRTHEQDNPETPQDESTCEIAGTGQVLLQDGTEAPFGGPGELGALMVDQGVVAQCATQQLYRFAMGRFQLDEYDHAFISLLQERVAVPGFKFADLLSEFVSNDSFRFRREEV